MPKVKIINNFDPNLKAYPALIYKKQEPDSSYAFTNVEALCAYLSTYSELFLLEDYLKHSPRYHFEAVGYEVIVDLLQASHKILKKYKIQIEGIEYKGSKALIRLFHNSFNTYNAVDRLSYATNQLIQILKA